MNAIDLMDVINAGETSKVQFIEMFTSKESMGREIVAMSTTPQLTKCQHILHLW
jgi:hypothetical protein